MSNLLPATLFAIAIGCFIWQRIKIAKLRHGQEEWRSVAMRRSEEATRIGEELTTKEGKMKVIAKAFEGLSAQYREIELRMQSTAAELEARNKELATTEGALSDIQEECARALASEQRAHKIVETLYSKGWALGYRAGGLGNFYIVRFEHNAPQIGIGAIPEDAIEDALLSEKRAQEGLES